MLEKEIIHKEIKKEIGNKFIEKEKSFLSKLKGKVEKLVNIFLVATIVGFGGELMASQIKEKIQEDVRLITTHEVLSNFIKAGVEIGKGTFIFPNQPWKGEKPRPLLSSDFTIAVGETDGITTDSLKITESEKEFAIISFNSDGSKDSVIVNKNGAVEKIISLDKEGKEIREFGEKEIQKLWEEQIKE